jgi:hypothetical protein
MRRVKSSLKLFREVALLVIRVKEIVFVLDIQRSGGSSPTIRRRVGGSCPSRRLKPGTA